MQGVNFNTHQISFSTSNTIHHCILHFIHTPPLVSCEWHIICIAFLLAFRHFFDFLFEIYVFSSTSFRDISFLAIQVILKFEYCTPWKIFFPSIIHEFRSFLSSVRAVVQIPYGWRPVNQKPGTGKGKGKRKKKEFEKNFCNFDAKVKGFSQIITINQFAWLGLVKDPFELTTNHFPRNFYISIKSAA